VVHHDALAGQHDPQPPITELATVERDLAKTRPQVAISTTPMRIFDYDRPLRLISTGNRSGS
jgi:hypothetical protein